MKYINVESDFKLLESFDCNCEVNLKDSEFTFVYYTKQYSNNKVEVSYKDGEYTNCKFTKDNRLIVLFENHKLEPGTLKVKRYFNLNDADFSDKTCDFVIEEELPISLTKGIQPCTEECCYVDVKLPPYYQKGDIGPVGPKGDKGDQGDKGDKGDLTVTGITPHNNLLDNTAFNQFDYEDNLLYWNIIGDAEIEIHGEDSGIGNNALLIKSYEDPEDNNISPNIQCSRGVGYVLSLYTKSYNTEKSTLLIKIPNLHRGKFYVDGQQGEINNLGHVRLEQSTNWEKHYIAFAVTRESPIFFAAPSTSDDGVLIAQVKLESNPINLLDDLETFTPTPWTLSANDLKGKDIYELLVESNKFEGTRKEFEDEYTNSIEAVKSATNYAIREADNAQMISQEVRRVELEIIQRESERSDAFDSAQDARQQAYIEAENKRASDYQKAENSRNSGFGSAENNRNNIFLQYESNRQNNETLRSNAEEDRKKAESDRQALFQSNEESRQNTFNTNETTRQNNESIRQTNEVERETKEAERQSIFSTNEAERQQIFETNEAIRKENETKRVDAETLRQEAETKREATLEEMQKTIPVIVNDLTTGGADKALSAEMGKELTKSSFNSPKMKGYVYNYGSGALVTTASLSGQCSSKIACLPNRLYYVKNKGLTGVRIIYWDATDTYINSFIYSEDTSRSVSPSNAAYMAVFTDTANTWEHIFIEDISDVDFLRVDFNTDVATTRKSVPYIFRRIGLVLSYIVDGERVLEVFNTTPGTYLNDYAWAADSAWDKFILNKEYEDQVAETAKVIDLTQKASYSKAEYISPVWTEGYYINDVGSVVADSNFKYSEPISLKGGDKITVYGRGTANVAIISLHIDGKYKPVIKGTNSISPEEFIYEANAECEVAVCYLSAWSSYYVARTSNELASKLLAQQLAISKIDASTIRLVKSKNLLDTSKSVVGLLRAEGNVQVSMADYLTSDYIEVKPNTSYTISSSSGNTYCYGEFLNDRIINYQTPNSKLITFNTSPTTNRLRISHVKTATGVQVEKGDTATSYEPYDKPTELGTDKEGRPIKVNVDVEEQFVVDHSENLLIFELFTRNGYNKWDNTYNDSNLYKTSSEVVPIVGGETYSYKNINFISLKYYDVNMNYVSVQYNPTSPFVVPTNARYAEISLGNASITDNGVLVKGESIPEDIKAGHFPIITSETKTKSRVFANLSDKTTVQANMWRGCKYASLGDSVTYRNHWQNVVDFHLGTTHVNLACSGMTVGGYAFHYITGGSESGSQIGAAVADRLLNANDFADCQLIIICGYANNFYAGSGQGTPLGSMSDGFKTISEADIANYSSVNEYRRSITDQSFIAACRSTVEYVQRVAPHARIILCGQLLMDSSYLAGWDANNIDLYRKNGQGLLTVDYSDAMKEVAEHYSIPYVDLARKGGVNNMNWHLYYPASDQVHPNFASYVGGEDYPDSGMYKMARGIIGVLESI